MRIAEILLEQRDPGVIAERYRRRLERRIPSDPTLTRLTTGCPSYEGTLPPATPEDVVAFIHHCVDPTQRKKYVDWIVRRWIEGHRSRDNSIGISHAEDFGRVRQALDIFDRRQRDLPPDRRDINRVKSLRELEELVAPLAQPTERQQRRKRRREIASLDDPANWNWVCRRPDHGVVVPRSHAESCAIAAHPRTRWCTAVRDDPQTFRSYGGEEGNLAILVIPGNIRSADEIKRLYQIALDDFQTMDEYDRPADLLELYEKYACVRDVLRDRRGIADLRELMQALLENADLQTIELIYERDPALVVEALRANPWGIGDDEVRSIIRTMPETLPVLAGRFDPKTLAWVIRDDILYRFHPGILEDILAHATHEEVHDLFGDLLYSLDEDLLQRFADALLQDRHGHLDWMIQQRTDPISAFLFMKSLSEMDAYLAILDRVVASPIPDTDKETMIGYALNALSPDRAAEWIEENFRRIPELIRAAFEWLGDNVAERILEELPTEIADTLGEGREPMRIAEILLEQRDPGVIAERYRRRLERRIPSDPTLARLTAGCVGYEGALPPATPEDVVTFIHHCVDPTQRKKYVDWIVRRWIEGHRSKDNSIGISHAEDFGRVRQALDIFERRQRDLPADRRDINRVKSLRELEELVAPLARPTERQQRRQRRREIASLDDPANWNWVCRRPDHGVVVPRSHAESCAIAAHPRTRWCTAVRDNPQMFESYGGKEGNLAIIVVPGNIRSADEIDELYQISLSDDEARDADDDLVSAWQLWAEYPCAQRIPFNGGYWAPDPEQEFEYFYEKLEDEDDFDEADDLLDSMLHADPQIVWPLLEYGYRNHRMSYLFFRALERLTATPHRARALVDGYDDRHEPLAEKVAAALISQFEHNPWAGLVLDGLLPRLNADMVAPLFIDFLDEVVLDPEGMDEVLHMAVESILPVLSNPKAREMLHQIVALVATDLGIQPPTEED